MGGRGPVVVSPEVHPDRTVTLRVLAPRAKSVTVSGEIAGTKPLTAAAPDAAGVWNFTTEPLPPDIYAYSFNIDGVSVPDRANRDPRFLRYTDSLGVSLVEVPGAPPNPWDVRPVPHGSVTHTHYASKAVGAERDYYVYTPPGYDPKRKDPYPVVFLAAWADGGGLRVVHSRQSRRDGR
jgi:enterochelin esterase family protein